MKVNELAKIVGISPSKLRYYDRCGVIEGIRNENNNYREYDQMDALMIYDTLMYRSYDMSMEDLLAQSKMDLNELYDWLDERIAKLEYQIHWDQVRLKRFKEMKNYYLSLDVNNQVDLLKDIEGHYSIYTLGSDLSDPIDYQFLSRLVSLFPFSYIAIKISNASLTNGLDYVESSVGVGMLERNVNLLNLETAAFSQFIEKGKCVSLLISVDNPFKISKQKLKPIYDWFANENRPLTNDIYGRLYFCDKTKNPKQFVMTLGCQF